MNQPMREIDPFALRDDFHQISLDLFGRSAFGDSQQRGNSLDVRVDHHAAGNFPNGSQDNVGRFAPDARQRHQIVERLGDLAAEPLDDPLGHAAKAIGFGTKKPVERMISSTSD